jgi:hypothetical protein
MLILPFKQRSAYGGNQSLQVNRTAWGLPVGGQSFSFVNPASVTALRRFEFRPGIEKPAHLTGKFKDGRLEIAVPLVRGISRRRTGVWQVRWQANPA